MLPESSVKIQYFLKRKKKVVVCKAQTLFTLEMYPEICQIIYFI